jgi:hypothetical protein
MKRKVRRRRSVAVPAANCDFQIASQDVVLIDQRVRCRHKERLRASRGEHVDWLAQQSVLRQAHELAQPEDPLSISISL